MAFFGKNQGRSYAEERDSQLALMREKRSAGREVAIPPCRNIRRRRRCLADPELFGRTYMADVFTNPFTDDTRDMLHTILDAIRYGGSFAVAAARGAGKTSIMKLALVYAICSGLCSFAIFVCKNQEEADERLAAVKEIFETGEALGEDFPEICVPIRALEGAAQRAGKQTVNGQLTRMRWSGNRIVLPAVAGSPASGAVLMGLGREGSIRGQNIRNKRPRLAIVDDIEDRESARSDTQTEEIKRIITADVAGLAGQNEPIAIVYLCTLIRKGCVADQLTDRQANPVWQGRRYKALVRNPDRMELWERYIDQCHRDFFDGDRTARRAHAFYLANRPEMDRGAVVGNPYRFVCKRLPDGSDLEVSALQALFNFVARYGWPAFNAEYQNDPPAEETPLGTGLQVNAVMGRCNGRPRGLVPAGCDYLTAFIDVHARRLNVVVAAWVGGCGAVIDYDALPVHSPLSGRPEDPDNTDAVDAAILAALCDWRDRHEQSGYPVEGTGEARHCDAVLIDARYRPDAVKAFVRSSGPAYRAAMGDGTGNGQRRYTAPASRGHGRRLGVHWHAARDPRGRVWIHHTDADFFKRQVHAGFQLPPELPGSLTLFGDDPIRHKNYGEQVLAEVWVREFQPGKGTREYWDVRSHHNHYLDATAGCIAAACMLGMPIVTDQAAQAVRETAAPPEAAAATDTTRTTETTIPATPTKRPPPRNAEAGPEGQAATRAAATVILSPARPTTAAAPAARRPPGPRRVSLAALQAMRRGLKR